MQPTKKINLQPVKALHAADILNSVRRPPNRLEVREDAEILRQKLRSHADTTNSAELALTDEEITLLRTELESHAERGNSTWNKRSRNVLSHLNAALTKVRQRQAK